MKPFGRLLLFCAISLLLLALTLGVGAILIPVYWALVIRGREARTQKAFHKLNATLMANEKPLEQTLQLKLCALTSRRAIVAITNSRMIRIERGLLGGFTMKDYQWKDLSDVQLSQNVMPHLFGSLISFQIRDLSKGEAATVEIDGIDNDVASKIYSHAQAQEQAWEEKHRVRGLEEKHAVVGLIGGRGIGNTNGAFEELERAKKLLDDGTVSDAEYQELKAKILSRAG